MSENSNNQVVEEIANIFQQMLGPDVHIELIERSNGEQHEPNCQHGQHNRQSNTENELMNNINKSMNKEKEKYIDLLTDEFSKLVKKQAKDQFEGIADKNGIIVGANSHPGPNCPHPGLRVADEFRYSITRNQFHDLVFHFPEENKYIYAHQFVFLNNFYWKKQLKDKMELITTEMPKIIEIRIHNCSFISFQYYLDFYYDQKNFKLNVFIRKTNVLRECIEMGLKTKDYFWMSRLSCFYLDYVLNCDEENEDEPKNLLLQFIIFFKGIDCDFILDIVWKMLENEVFFPIKEMEWISQKLKSLHDYKDCYSKIDEICHKKISENQKFEKEFDQKLYILQYVAQTNKDGKLNRMLKVFLRISHGNMMEALDLYKKYLKNPEKVGAMAKVMEKIYNMADEKKKVLNDNNNDDSNNKDVVIEDVD